MPWTEEAARSDVTVKLGEQTIWDNGQTIWDDGLTVWAGNLETNDYDYSEETGVGSGWLQQ